MPSTLARSAMATLSRSSQVWPEARTRVPRVRTVRKVPKSVGTNVRRKDGDAKVTGAAKYIDDLTFPGMLYGATIRSTIPRGKISGRRVSLPPEFIVADHRDIPGKNYVALIEPDQPCLAVDEVRHVAEPILLVAHAQKHALIGIEQRVAIDYKAAAPNYDPEKSDLCFKKISIDKGQID